MNDVISVAAIVGFFALATGYARWCERIVERHDPQPHPVDTPAASPTADTDRVPA